jgi:hypothetical protein
MISVPTYAINIDQTLTKQAAIQDLNLYFELIDEQHGNPYAYISRIEFKALVDVQVKALPENISQQDFSILLSELNQKLRCGHTAVSIDTQTLKRATEKSEFFPYAISIIENEIFIDFEEGNIPLGSRVLSINGISSAQMVTDLTALTITDGFIETKKLREIEQKFGYYYFLKYGPIGQFKVSYDFDGKVQESLVQGVPASSV